MPPGIYLDEMFGIQVAARLAARAGPQGLHVELAKTVQPGRRDSELLAYAARHQLTLVTRNLEDFLRLHALWLVDRDWGHTARPHAGLLIPAGAIEGARWAGIVMDLLLHPRCPPLADQLWLWSVALSRWESDHPYASRRRRSLTL